MMDWLLGCNKQIYGFYTLSMFAVGGILLCCEEGGESCLMILEVMRL
jgi:hypothetical protein